ncbi:MAG TPA: glycosyltransferase family 39 protein, partial [Thermoanaerobaculia bacterium]
FALLAVDPLWVFAGIERDPWLYYGYFRHAPQLVASLPDLYYASRLSVILPGFLLHHALPPLAANLLLHAALHATATLALYGSVRPLLGRRAALLSALALGCHPFFLLAAGRNYVDAFGLAYVLLAFYFLTRAALGGGRWTLLLAGACVTALVTANLFYVVFLPFLALHFAALDRRRGRFWRSLLRAAVGAAVLCAAFCVLSKLWGGHFLFPRASVRWLLGYSKEPTIFRSPIATWIGRAHWLVVPALVTLAAALLLLRAWQNGRGPWTIAKSGPPALLFQLELALFALAMVFCQLGSHSPVLQYFFYASLLLPFVFLALAGQLVPLLERLAPRRFALAAAAALLLLAAPLALSLRPPVPDLVASAPVAVPLALGAAVVAVALLGRGGLGATLLLVLSLGAAQLAAIRLANVDKVFETFSSDRRALFVTIDRCATAFERVDPALDLRLWYDVTERNDYLYDPLAATLLLCPHLLTRDFPGTQKGTMCDGARLGPGQTIAVFSTRPAAEREAATALRPLGLSVRKLGAQTVDGAGAAFTLTFLQTGSARAR